MFLFSIKSKVNRRSKVSEKFHNVGGAYVSCFISFKDFEAAEKLAKLLIREQGWIPEKSFEAWTLQKREMRRKKDKQYYAEALKYGYCLVFHHWEKDAPDANTEYESAHNQSGRRPRSKKRLQRTRR
jgi:hypothetical protein